MTAPSRVCPACYAINPWVADVCVRCGASLERGEAFDERLLWALDHPDTATAELAARLLAARGERRAIEPLGRLLQSADPYRAAAAARALLAFAGDPAADVLIAEARRHPSVMVRRAVDPRAETAARGAEHADPRAETAAPGAEHAEPRAETAAPGAEHADPRAETAARGAEHSGLVRDARAVPMVAATPETRAGRRGARR
jgi:hypothetical protein